MRHAVAAAVAVAMTLTACARAQYSSQYPNMVEASVQDAVTRGWIPEFLPEDATGLRELHDPQTDAAVIVATLPGGIVPDACVEVDSLGSPPLMPAWVPDGIASAGTPFKCDGWMARTGDSQIVIWADPVTSPSS